MTDIQDRILYEDNHIIIVNKLVGEITQGDKTLDRTLGDDIKALIARRDKKPGAVYLGIPHRLDRPVSGVAMFAKTSKALERLNAMFRNSQVHKTYWALVCREPEQKEGYLEDYIYRIEKQNKSYICKTAIVNGETKPVRADAKLAKLRYKYIGRTERYFIVEVELLTGRHHQIRCQLSHHLSPIKGDLKYGAPRSNPDGGICLHARRIEFIHPVKKEPVCIEAPLPENWKITAPEAEK
ncbi:MAG: RluA family pseudouridine synthase [Bacteroidales bacterium]|nr:RluA family pseudouridine synthase [Bacteroidales bacterium]